MSTITMNEPTFAYEADQPTVLSASTKALIAFAVIMLGAAFTGVAAASPVVTTLAGLCTVFGTIAAVFSMTREK